MNDENTQSEPAIETPTTPIQVSEPITPPIEEVESTPEVPQVSAENQPISVDEEPPIKQEASPTPEPVQASNVEPAPAPQTSVAPQPQSLAQQDQTGFIRNLLLKAQAKIQFNKQKKLDKIIQFAQKKQIITNDDIQKLLRVSDATATRYLVKLVQQGHFARAGNPRDAKYQFLH